MTNCLPNRFPGLAGRRRIVAGWLLAQLIGCAPRPSPSVADHPTDAPAPSATNPSRAERGKAIYLTGISSRGQPIRARLSGGGAEVPAAVLTCGNCHGRDGIGKAEGGITPATVLWDELTKEYSLSHPSGRRRPAYNERSVRRAITMGLDPAGRPLDPSMPRYSLSHEDLDDLVAYLKELGRDDEPGITDQAIVLGTLLAPPTSLGGMSRAVRSVLTAYFEEVNKRGGIYGRRVELRLLEAPESTEDRAPAARRFMGRQDVFALLAPFIAGSDDEVTDAASEEKVPILGPFTLYPRSGSPLNRYVFFLHAGLTDQARALAVFASDRLAGRKPSATILFLDDEVLSSAAKEVETECRRMGWGPIDLFPIARDAEPQALAERLKQVKVDVVFTFLPEWRGIDDMLRVATRLGDPLVLIPGALAGEEVLGAMSRVPDRFFLSYPTLPLDTTPEGSAEYARLATAHGLPREHRSSQIAALAAAKIFVEAMTAAGRTVTREKLIEELEHFYEKPNGLTRPITYGPNRRFGTRGAYILGIDPRQSKLVPVSRYIEPPTR